MIDLFNFSVKSLQLIGESIFGLTLVEETIGARLVGLMALVLAWGEGDDMLGGRRLMGIE